MDTTAPTGSVDLEAGQSAAIQINLTVTGQQDGTATFQVNSNWSLSGGTFTGSNPQTITVPPRTAHDPATTYPVSGTVSVASGQATGTFTLSVPVFGITNSNTMGAKLGAGSTQTYTVHVVPPSDSTPPVITPNVSGTLGNNGWYTSDVTVSWSVTDPDSPISSSSGCGTTTISTDTTGQTLTCSATSAGGTASKSVTIKRDATPPVLTATPSAAANTNGYNNSPVDVTYTCSDATSGLADACPGTDSATTDGTHVFSHTIHDSAGNSASVSTTVNLDSTKPSITGSASPPANGNGWNNSDVTVTFACSDTGTGASGIDTCVADGTSPATDHATLSSDGANQSVSGTATDKAGNSNTATVSGINIDKTAPVITFDSRTPANGNGWNNSDVTVTWDCSDPGGSGVVHPTVAQTLTGEGANQSATGTCEDLAGNTATATVSGINIDKTPPVITFDNRTPANGNGWNNSDVTVTWDCSDAISEPVHDAVAVAVASEGANQSATGTCEDLAGNTASDTHGGINIDKAPPSVAYTSASPAPNAHGWNNTDVTATFTATDNLSGFDQNNTLTMTKMATTSGEGSAVTVDSPAFTDLAGNTAGAGAATSPAFKIDKTPPVIQTDPTNDSCSLGGNNGWCRGTQYAGFKATDNLSGFDANGTLTSSFTASTSTQGSQVYISSGPVSDYAGNQTAAIYAGPYMIDSTPPTVTCGPAPTFLLNQSAANVSATVADPGGSGPASSTVTGAADTSAAGTHSVSVTGYDNAGNSTTVSCPYSVIYTFVGFLPPLNSDQTGTVLNVGNAGKTYPIKWQLTDANGNYVTNAVSGTSIYVAKIACSNVTGDATDSIDYASATGSTALRYDSTANQYIYNWQTPSTKNTCYRMTVTTPDNQTHIAVFQLK